MQQLLALNIENIILWTACGLFLIQLFYFLFFFARMMTKGKKENEKNELKPVSVIVCARNEEDNLREFIPLLLSQNYKRFQLVIINDRSWDESWDVMQLLSEQDERITLVNIPDAGKDGFAKKFALTVGIKAAKYDRMVFIDADCYPASDDWLEGMVEKFSVSKLIVLGAGGYVRKKGLLNKMIRFDTNMIALQYLSFAKAGLPYMGIGRNLGYKNELYDSIRGFKSHYHIKSGDDDLFVNEVSNRKNTAICLDEKHITLSVPEEKFSKWILQKRRHLTTGKHYRFVHKFFLFWWPFSTVFFLIASVLAIVLHPMWYIPTALLSLRYLLLWMVSWRVFKTLRSKDVWIALPILEIFMLILMPILLLTNKKGYKQY